MYRFISLILAALSQSGVRAFPSYRSRVPNGHRVPCPPGEVGCKDGICQGVGHATCYGGSLPHNSFGQDMKKHDYQWSKELCEADSDGDGLSNGEELGDPCCLWKAWGIPSDYTANFTPSHPGVKTAKLESYQRPVCSKTTPKVLAPIMGKYNPGEVQKSVDLRIDNYSLPVPGNMGGRTTYIDIAWNFPDDSAEEFHIVWAGAIVATPKNLHHYVVRGCADPWPKEQDGKVLKDKSKAEACKISMGGWAPGSDIMAMPSWAGKSIGKKAGMRAFVVNVHIDNPAMETGIVMRDGMRIHYTPTLRNESLTGFSTMQVSVNPTMYIPPSKSRYYMTRECTVKVQDKFQKDVEARILGASFHAHLLGTDMIAERVRGNERIQISHDSPWHFDDQYFDNVYVRNLTFKTGDKIQSTCIFNSQSRDKLTVVGIETVDEMCWSSFQLIPGNLQVTCDGHVWTGELSASESLIGLQLRHPEKGADGSWTGKSLRSGGSVITAKYMPEPELCNDDKRLKSMCPGLVNKMAMFGPTACNKTMAEMGRKNGLIAKLTPLQLCCTNACSELCPDHAVCKAKVLTGSTKSPGAGGSNAGGSTKSPAAGGGSTTASTISPTASTKPGPDASTNGHQHSRHGEYLVALVTGWTAMALAF